MRKEYTIEIEYEGGEKEQYKVTTSFKALAMIEQRTTPSAVLQRIARKDPRMSDLVWVVYCCIAAAGYKGKNVTEEKIGEAFNSLPLGVAHVQDMVTPILIEWMPKAAVESAAKKEEPRQPRKPRK